MKKIHILFSLILMFLISSCGHNIYTSSKGLGVDLSWNPDSYVPSFRGGLFQVITFIPRGNVTMSTTNATGGVLGNGGTSQTIIIKSGIQLNQGNIVQICNNPMTGDAVKLAAVQNVSVTTSPTEVDTNSKTTSAVAATGTQAKNARPGTTGLDKIVEAVSDNGDNIKEVANNTVNNVEQAYSNTVDKAESAYSNTTSAFQNIMKHIKTIIVSIVILLILIIIICGYIYLKHKKNKQAAITNQQTNNQQQNNTSQQNTLDNKENIQKTQ